MHRFFERPLLQKPVISSKLIKLLVQACQRNDRNGAVQLRLTEDKTQNRNKKISFRNSQDSYVGTRTNFHQFMHQGHRAVLMPFWVESIRRLRERIQAADTEPESVCEPKAEKIQHSVLDCPCSGQINQTHAGCFNWESSGFPVVDSSLTRGRVTRKTVPTLGVLFTSTSPP